MASFSLGLRLVCGAAVVLSACGAQDASGVVSSCVPGRQTECACPGGTKGVQICDDDRTYGACECAELGSDSGTHSDPNDGTGNAPTAPGQLNPGSSQEPDSTAPGNTIPGVQSTGLLLHQGSERLISTFPTELGVLVILDHAVVLVDREGAELERVEMPREITSAAFDGTLLGIADQAILTVFDLELQEHATATLLETCASSVMVSGARFICGPSNDWDRVLYTYDADTGDFLASSTEYTYNGIPMQAVPGTDDFITVTEDLSPSDFHLYSVTDTHEAVFINESPYHGDFRVTATYGFWGNPATHLITDEGLLLQLYGEGCSTETNSVTSECFIKDGAVGTLTGSQLFLGLASEDANVVAAIVDASPGSFGDPICENGCLVQRIDVEQREIISEKVYHFSAGAIEVVRHDGAGLIVGSRNEGDYYFGEPYPGHTVTLLPYE